MYSTPSIRTSVLPVLIWLWASSGVTQPEIDPSFDGSDSFNLSWPDAQTGFVVQSSAALTNAPGWETIPRSPVIQSNEHLLSVTLGPRPAEFFRLVQPNYANAVAGGLAFLQISQTDGTWGAGVGEERRDIHTIVDTLAGFGAQDLVEFELGVMAFAQLESRNHDDAARKAIVLALGSDDPTLECDYLLLGQNGAVTNAADVDFPGYGWGLGSGLDNDHIDTALAVRALKQAGKPTGLALAEAQITTAQGTVEHRFVLPSGASNFEMRISQQTGTLKYTLLPPGGVAQSLTNPGGSVPTTVPLDPNFPGVWTLTVENLAGVDVTYSLAVGFTAADGFDSFTLAAAIEYLLRHQNGDGGWGLRPGESSLLVVTYEVMRTLAACSRDNYGPWLDTGAAWLLAKQNGDGGFSSEPNDSNIYETAMALDGIRSADPANLAPAAMTWLKNRQQTIGSWDDDPFLTALAVRALSLAPIVSAIPDQVASIPAPFAPIALDDFVLDPDHADNLLAWEATGQSVLSVTISDRVAAVTYPPGTVVTEQITFAATDPDGLTGQATATFTVESAPPDYTIPAGGMVNDTFLITSVDTIPPCYSQIVSSTAPPGINWTLGSLTGSGNQRTQAFSISVSGGTAPGVYDFTVVIRLISLITFQEVPNLNGTTQDYRIEVTP